MFYFSKLCLVFQQTLEAWRGVFLLAAGMYVGCNVVFIMFGSGSVQHWNNAKEREQLAEDVKYDDEEEIPSAAKC